MLKLVVDNAQPISQINTSNPITNGEEYMYLKSQKQDLIEIFIHNCDRELENFNFFQWGINELKQTQEIFPKDLPDEIKLLQNSPFYFLENSKDAPIMVQQRFNDEKTANTLLNTYRLNRSQILSLGYARFFESFFKAYNGELELDYGFKLFSKEQIRIGAMKTGNTELQKTLLEFPQINKDNLEYLLLFWEEIKYGDNIISY